MPLYVHRVLHRFTFHVTVNPENIDIYPLKQDLPYFL